MLTNLDLLYILAREYQSKKINDTDDYKRWLLYGFACASFGEAGRSAFKTFSRSSYKYEERNADKQYNACLRSYKGERESLKNILALLKDAGILLKNLLK